MRRDHVHLCMFMVNIVWIGALVGLLTLLQGSGYVQISSDKLVANSLEVVLLLVLLAGVATFLLVEFFLIGIPNLALLAGG